MPDYYGWGSRNLADTSLPGNEWAKEAREALREAGLPEPSGNGAQYIIERMADGKLAVVGRITSSGRRTPLHPRKGLTVVQE